MASRKAPDNFATWFALQSHAAAGQWDDMVKILQRGSCPAIARHPFTIKAFGDAAAAGQDSVVRMMLRRGFTLGQRDAPFMIAAAATGEACREKIKITAEILRCTGADAAALAVGFAQSGNTAALALIHLAGGDVTAGGKSIYGAFYRGHAKCVEALAHCGASLYEPALIAEVYKPTLLTDPDLRPEMLARWRTLMLRDKETHALLEEFAAAGNGLSADMLLRPRNTRGLTMLAVLAAHEKLGEVFVPARWVAAPQDAEKVHEALTAFNAQDCVNFEIFNVQLKQKVLQARQPDAGARFRL